jgi:GT2 family glycosyltransferase
MTSAGRASPVAGPVVSVIVPVHNYGHLIAETLASVQRQSEPSWEVIVLDDGSTDATADVVARLAGEDPRIRYARQGHAGLSAARNHGLRLARGRYVQFLDADDLIEEQKLARQVALLDRHPDVGIVYGAVRYFDSDRPGLLRQGRYQDEHWMPCVSGTDEVLLALVQGNIMVVHAALARRRTIEAQGGFDPALRTVEDWDLWLRCAIAGITFRYADLPGTRSLVRVHARSLSQDGVSMAGGAATVREKLAAILPTSPRLRRALDEAALNWHRQAEQAAREIATALPDTGTLIVVDEGQVLCGRDERPPRVLPMMERDGRFWQRPGDDREALEEVTRLRSLGAVRIAFAFNAFWWLDHYQALRDYVLRRARPVHRSAVLKVYEFTA